MDENILNDVTIKRLQLISGLVDVIVDLSSQGASVRSDVVTNVMNELVGILTDVQQQIEEQDNVEPAKDRSGFGSNVNIKGQFPERGL